MSDIYPLVICVLTAFGSISGLEFYFAILHTALIFVGLAVSRSIRPTVISLLTYVMQLSVVHSPFHPSYSDYYYTGWRLPCFVAICAVTLAGLVIFVVRNKIYKKISFKNSPLLLPLIILSAAFILNGLFSDRWTSSDLVFGFANAVTYAVVFLLLYHGFSDGEDSRELSRYFSYISMLIALVIIAELLALFMTSDTIFINGAINKVEVSLGWGIWNLVGSSLAVLIPVIFYGVHSNKYPWLYFAVATIAWLFAVLTMSRNALIFSSLAYAACVIISCVAGKNKRVFRVVTAVGVAVLAVAAVLLWDKIYSVLLDYFNRGLSDNGRFEIWRAAWKSFLSDPIFGGGFYGLNLDDEILYSFGPLAKQAHNTVIQLLSAMGVVGLLSYAYYRYESLKTVFCRPTLKKTFMAMSIGVLLFGSLLDNFIFNIYPMFHYSVALVIIHKSAREENRI